MNRRQFIQHAGAFGAAAALGLPSVARAAEGMSQPMPLIRIGSLAVSRLVLGSNQYGGWAHRPGDAGKEMLAWYTDERVLAELDEAAALGINCVSIPPSDRWHRLWKTHKEKGGKMAFWIAQPAAAPDQMPADIEAAVKNGAKAVYIQRSSARPPASAPIGPTSTWKPRSAATRAISISSAYTMFPTVTTSSRTTPPRPSRRSASSRSPSSPTRSSAPAARGRRKASSSP
jgi:hypothetical protein